MKRMVAVAAAGVIVGLGLWGCEARRMGAGNAEIGVVDVWPAGKMPGQAATQPEGEMPAKGDGYHRVTNVSVPTLTIFAAKRAGGSGVAPAMIVCPGGGYSYLVVDKEGSEIAGWLNGQGITALVLKYRVPHNREGALQDVERAIRVTRAHAGEWGIDPKRVGVMGFSAGGNLAAKVSTQFGKRSYAAVDGADREGCRPDFAVLVYPAYLEDQGKLTGDVDMTARIPPTLIVHNEDDKTFAGGSKLYHAALDAAGDTNELLMYATGGHGYGLHCTGEAKAWPGDARAWLKKMGVE